MEKMNLKIDKGFTVDVLLTPVILSIILAINKNITYREEIKVLNT